MDSLPNVYKAISLFSALVLVACGGDNSKDDAYAPPPWGGGSGNSYTEAEFIADFIDRYCAEATQCNADFDCSLLEGSDDVEMTCTYDEDKAQDCIDGVYECDEDLGFVTPPEECAEALVCEEIDDDDDGG